MAAHEWIRQAGNAAAKEFIRDYPSPRALRAVVRERNIHDVLPEAVKALPVPDTPHTLGWFLNNGGLWLTVIHSIIAAHARDREVWTAPDGTKTRGAV